MTGFLESYACLLIFHLFPEILRRYATEIENQIIQLGYPPKRIDLLTTIPDVVFDQCYPQRQTIEIDSVLVKFIDLENLKKNKRASGRAQDLADLENLA